MAKRKTKAQQPKPEPRVYPIVVEVFDGHDANPLPFRFGQAGEYNDRPRCFNGLAVDRYRVTVERIDEPRDVIIARMVKLWREGETNMHHVDHYKRRAAELGIITDEQFREVFAYELQGIDSPRRKERGY